MMYDFVLENFYYKFNRSVEKCKKITFFLNWNNSKQGSVGVN